MHERHQPGTARQQLVERIQIQITVIGHRHVGQLSLPVLTQELPGHDVRVVLHLGQHHEVSPVHVAPPPRVRHQVHRGRGVRREDRLLRRRSQPVRDPPPRALVQIGRFDGERVDAAVDRRPRLRVITRHRIDHGLRRLRGGRGVEVHEAVTVERPVAQDGELVRDPPKVRGNRGHAAASIESVIHP